MTARTLLLTTLPLLAACAPKEPPTPPRQAEPEPAVAREPGAAVEAARAFRAEHGHEVLADFAALLAIPNVASDLEDVRRNAVAIRDRFAARGATMELWELEGAPPVVFGRLPASAPAGERGAAPTLGLYVHYDGQPATPERWSSPPWEPVLLTGDRAAGGVPRPWPAAGEPIDPEWRVQARSAGDDKAPLAAMLAALDALEAAGVPRTRDLVLLFEGEEEAGSDHLESYLDAHRDALREVDAWLICDGPVHASRRPQLVFGVRGVTGLEITVYGATRSLHSGHYGNWAPNPGLMLAQLLASMKDVDGNVLVAGFHDTVLPLGEAERAALAAVPDVDAELARELGLARTEGRPGEGLAERLLLPSLNVRGIRCAEVGAGARNVIPSEATAALDVRLVAGNDPEDLVEKVEAHVRAQGYHVVRDAPDHAMRLAHPRIARIVREGGYPAARTSLDHPIVPELADAVERTAGEPPILVPSLGGSLPLYLFTRDATPVVIVPIANHDDNQHAPDENLRLANLWYGIDLFATLFAP